MLRFLPWRFFVKRAARRYGVIDPAMVLARIRRFAQPSEVAEPLELLRAGIVFHARGLVNSKSIQHNLDWVWPYWVERQFNPSDPSFVPRAFSFSHINLTHRNWTAVGLPGVAFYPIVDPRGLVTPLHDGWSLDFWIVTDSGKRLIPSKLPAKSVKQQLLMEPTLTVATESVKDGLGLQLATTMILDEKGTPEVVTWLEAAANEPGWLVVTVRPYNPEGVQFIDRIQMTPEGDGFKVNDGSLVKLGERPDGVRMAHYAEGDVYLDLPGETWQKEITCDVGLATAAALFRLEPGKNKEMQVAVTLERDLKTPGCQIDPSLTWQEALDDTAELKIHDPHMQFLYDSAVRTILLLSACDLVPGPYTYRRFWFRDACLMLHPLIAIGLVARAERVLAGFPAKQTAAGYFLSQEGEWDSNGQVLWIAARHAELSGRELGKDLDRALRKAVDWLDRKRLRTDKPPGTRGLLPAGFSAEHLGPNDYYYWDDYWALGGLRAIARHWGRNGDPEAARRASELAAAYSVSIEASIEAIPASRSKGGAIPAAPGRRMDAGAIGSMVADYPLQVYPPGHPGMKKTTNFLIDHCFHGGGFFQEMIHSGINAYLTLDLAQTLLRAGDGRYADLVRRVAELASPTGQWPEAIHPQSLGGCMGDGQHGWAAGEWIMLIRNAFIREEEGMLIIGSGILPEWQAEEGAICFGPTHTPWGPVTVHIHGSQVELDAGWRGAAPRVRIALPGHVPLDADASLKTFLLQKS